MHLGHWDKELRLGNPVRPQPFARAVLDLHGQVESFGNVIGRLDGPQERRGEDVLDSFVAKSGTRFLRLHDAVGREMRIQAFP